MKTKLKTITAAVLMTTALTVGPATALSINLGGEGGLLDLGGSGNSNSGSSTSATIGVNTGNLLGGGGSDDEPDDRDGGALINLGGEGGLLNLGGGDSDGLIDLGGDGGLLNLGGDDGVINLGSADGGLLDLGSDGDLLDFGDAYLLDLGGDGDGLDVDATLLNGNTVLDLNARGAAAGIVDVGDANVLIDLGSTGSIGGGSGPAAEVDVNLGGTGIAVDIGGSGNGGGDDDDDNGNGGNDGNGGGDDGSGGGSNTDVAANMSAEACLSLTEPQLRELVNRHEYTAATFTSWAGVRSLKIVPVDLCAGAISEVSLTVAASPNIDRLQAFLASQAKVVSGLASKGYSPDDVIAADEDGTVLIVYVL